MGFASNHKSRESGRLFFYSITSRPSVSFYETGGRFFYGLIVHQYIHSNTHEGIQKHTRIDVHECIVVDNREQGLNNGLNSSHFTLEKYPSRLQSE